LRTFRLGDVCEKIGSGATPRGGSDVYLTSGVALIRSQNVYNDGFKKEGLAFIDKIHADELSNVTIHFGDVLLNITGDSVARVCQVPDEVLPARVNQHVAIIRPNKDDLDARYLRYFLVSPQMQQQMIAFAAAGATRNALTKGMIESFEVPVPPVPEQKAIAHILGSMDDKIELNHRMNETLEAIARTIFKSWFVDFDPVRAKAEGREPDGMDAEMAALFPDSFRDSNLGEIPDGWTVTRLETQIDIKHGYAFKGLYFREEPTDNILLTPGNFAIGGGFKSDKLKYYNGPVPEDFVLGAGDLIVTMTDLSKLGDTLGYPAIIPPLIGSRYLHNQRLGKIIFRSGATIGKFILFQVLCSESYRNYILGSASGSTVKHTSPGRIKQYEIVLPTKLIIKKYEQLANSLQDRIEANFKESLILTEIRDSLLPKLLSGQIQLMSFEVQEATHND